MQALVQGSIQPVIYYSHLGAIQVSPPSAGRSPGVGYVTFIETLRLAGI